jgi:hypothetical protein
MAQRYYLTILSDLMESEPLSPLILPDPYDVNLGMQDNIKNFYRLLRWSIRANARISGLINAYYLGYLFEVRLSTPMQRRTYRNALSKHYLDACVRVYNLFSIIGPQQIYRTKRASFWMFRKLKRSDYLQLTQDAWTFV